jgi:hypothetical protein
LTVTTNCSPEKSETSPSPAPREGDFFGSFFGIGRGFLIRNGIKQKIKKLRYWTKNPITEPFSAKNRFCFFAVEEKGGDFVLAEAVFVRVEGR